MVMTEAAQGRLAADGDVEKVLCVMANATSAVPLVAEILEGLDGWSMDRLQDSLEEAESRGFLTHWECEAGLAVVFTDLTATRLGLRLEGGTSDLSKGGRYGLKWQSHTKAESPRPTSRGSSLVSISLESELGSEDHPFSLDDLPCEKGLDQAECVDGVGWFEGKRRSARPGQPTWVAREILERGLLRHLKLVGLRYIWTGEQFEEPCGSCGGLELGDLEVCIRCNRSWMDNFGLIGKPPRPTRQDQATKRSSRPKAGRAKKRKSGRTIRSA